MFEELKIPQGLEGFIFLHNAAKNPPTLPPHRHAEIECNLVISGEITYLLGNQRFTLKEGELLWLFPHQTHQLVDRSYDAKCYVVVFTPELVERSCRSEAHRKLIKSKDWLPSEQLFSKKLSSSTMADLARQMEGLVPGMFDARTLNREVGFGLNSGFSYDHEDPDFLNAGLAYLLLRCWREDGSFTEVSGTTALHPSIRKAILLLEKSGGELTGTALAEQCHISSSHLSRLFHKEVGVTMKRYKHSLQLARFWKAFESGSRPNLLEAAYEGGFGSYSQFFRVFKEFYGYSPKDLIKSSR